MGKGLLAVTAAAGLWLCIVPTSGAAAEAAGSQTSINGATSADSPNAVSGAAIVQTALKYLGYPYTTVGHSPSEGFSCIGFVSYVYQSNGIPLPDDLWLAQAYAPAVTFSNLLPGDILFFKDTVWTGLSHTAIYIGAGKFVHAEWYNRGVVISSFNDDPVDFNYWIGKYLGASRPWGGVMGAVPQTTTTPIAGATPTPVTKLSGTPAVVSVSALNVRSGPSKANPVQTVVKKGTQLTVVSQNNGWSKVQLPDGTVGWVFNDGIVMASASNPATAPRSVKTTITVSALRVHTGPSIKAPVIGVVLHGQRVSVLGQKGGWVRITMLSGKIGWVSGAYITVPSRPAKLTATVRVHSSPGIKAPVLTVAKNGTRVRVLGKDSSWVQIRLPGGTSGYVYGLYVR